jgi:hypothetical protein
VAEALGHLFGDFPRQLPILGIREVELLPISVFGAAAIFVDAERLGVLLG